MAHVSLAALHLYPSKTIASPKMPFAPVDSKGTEFYYEDTGAPKGTTAYTTLLLIHGAVFNSGTRYLVLVYL